VRLPLVDRLLAAVMPWCCVLCRDAAAGMDLCIDCLNDLPWLQRTCRFCGISLPAAGLRICGVCSKTPPLVQHTVAALNYEFPVPEMIAAMKFGKQTCFARVLGELLSIRLQELVCSGNLLLPDVLVPVPLSRWRQFRRGFNQSDVIAACVAASLHVPVDNFSLRRTRNTPPQSGLRRTARQKNLRGCFHVGSQRLAGKHVALIDDVITTGSTVTEIARTLHQQGVAGVQVWAVARVCAV
jgi:ComF family protein